MSNNNNNITSTKDLTYNGISMYDIVSCEYLLENGNKRHILNGLSIDIDKREILGISGRTRTELLILIELLGNMRPYYKGSAKLSKHGVQRAKRRIIDEIFYIDSASMLYGKMTVLEQIMFAITSKKVVGILEKQKLIMDLLVRLGMKGIMLQPIDNLSDNTRIIVAILVGLLSQSEMVVANIVDYVFTQEEIMLLEQVAVFARQFDKGLVIATMQAKLIGIVCQTVAYVINGKVHCHESVDTLCDRYDNVVCIVKGADSILMKNIIEDSMLGVNCYESNQLLVIESIDGANIKIGEIYDLFDTHDVDFDYIKVNKGRVTNSFEELIRLYDLQ